MGAVRDLDAVTFDETVSSGRVVVDFWASWCGPCKMIAPIVAELAVERPDVTFAKVNVDDHPDLAARFEVRSIPTMLIFDSSSVPCERLVGARPKHALVAALDAIAA